VFVVQHKCQVDQNENSLSFVNHIFYFLAYLNSLPFLPQPIVDPKQQQQQANVYSHHQMLMSSKNGSIMNGYPLQPQQ
jgi:hypothetical protein